MSYTQLSASAKPPTQSWRPFYPDLAAPSQAFAEATQLDIEAETMGRQTSPINADSVGPPIETWFDQLTPTAPTPTHDSSYDIDPLAFVSWQPPSQLSGSTNALPPSTLVPKKAKKLNVHALFSTPAVISPITSSQTVSPSDSTFTTWGSAFPGSDQISPPPPNATQTSNMGPWAAGNPRMGGAISSGQYYQKPRQQGTPHYYGCPQGHDPYVNWPRQKQDSQHPHNSNLHHYIPQTHFPPTQPIPHTRRFQPPPSLVPPAGAPSASSTPAFHPFSPIFTQTTHRETQPSALPPSLNFTAPNIIPSSSMRRPVRINTPNGDPLTFEGRVPPRSKAKIPAVAICAQLPRVVVRMETVAQKEERLAKEKEEKERRRREEHAAQEETELKKREKEDEDRKAREEEAHQLMTEPERKKRLKAKRKAWKELLAEDRAGVGVTFDFLFGPELSPGPKPNDKAGRKEKVKDKSWLGGRSKGKAGVQEEEKEEAEIEVEDNFEATAEVKEEAEAQHVPCSNASFGPVSDHLLSTVPNRPSPQHQSTTAPQPMENPRSTGKQSANGEGEEGTRVPDLNAGATSNHATSFLRPITLLYSHPDFSVFKVYPGQSKFARVVLDQARPPGNTNAISRALSHARFIEDLSSIQYPADVAPNSKMNITIMPGKIRYHRDFMLQFMEICKEKPDSFPSLEGVESEKAANTGARDRRRIGSTNLGGAPSPQHQTPIGNFQSVPGRSEYPQPRFGATTSSRSGVSVPGPVSSHLAPTAHNTSQRRVGEDGPHKANFAQRTRSQRGSSHGERWAHRSGFQALAPQQESFERVQNRHGASLNPAPSGSPTAVLTGPVRKKLNLLPRTKPLESREAPHPAMLH